MDTLHLPKGFRFAAVSAGIKHKAGARDVALVVSDHDAVAAGVYTQNQVVAAPVTNCRSKTPSTSVRAVIVNSGNANACTGTRGEADAAQMCACTSDLLGFSSNQTLVMSTGVIGHFLPMERVETGIRGCVSALAATDESFLNCADGILATDQGRKIATAEIQLSGGPVRIAAMAKGAGMIGPNMATMLCCVVTDAHLTAEQCQRLLAEAADQSFNNISVEGHTSTNDTMLLLANGTANPSPLSGQDESDFAVALNELCRDLAKLIPLDGEGATHLIEIHVHGTYDDQAAQTIAKSVAASNLVKTAVYGNDPNWGRIVSAAGYAGPKIDMTQMDLRVNEFLLFESGQPVAFDDALASQSLSENRTCVIDLKVGRGPGRCTHWCSDLTVEYVRFNSDYTT